MTTCSDPELPPVGRRLHLGLAATSAVRASIHSRLRYRITGTVCLVVGRVVSAAVEVIGRGTKVFTSPPVHGELRVLDAPDDVIALMDDGATGVIALVRDAGATFLAPIFHELAGVVCTGGTPRSHIGIVSREFHVPCVMGCAFADGEPASGRQVEVDCSAADGEPGLVRG
jgi:phosphohistidine swiveling domain-containing protein